MCSLQECALQTWSVGAAPTAAMNTKPTVANTSPLKKTNNKDLCEDWHGRRTAVTKPKNEISWPWNQFKTKNNSLTWNETCPPQPFFEVRIAALTCDTQSKAGGKVVVTDGLSCFHQSCLKCIDLFFLRTTVPECYLNLYKYKHRGTPTYFTCYNYWLETSSYATENNTLYTQTTTEF